MNENIDHGYLSNSDQVLFCKFRNGYIKLNMHLLIRCIIKSSIPKMFMFVTCARGTRDLQI